MRIEHLNWMRRLNENKNAACQGFAMGKGFELRIGENVRHPRHIMFHSSFFKRNYLFFIFFYIFIPPAITESENNENVRLANTHSASRMICINNLFFYCSVCLCFHLLALLSSPSGRVALNLLHHGILLHVAVLSISWALSPLEIHPESKRG